MDNIKILTLDFVNAFLIEAGDGFILIDTGFPQHWERLEKELLSAKCLPDKLKLVVLTHGDVDHTGSCAKLQKKYQAKIAMHTDDVTMAETGIPLDRKVRTFGAKIFVMVRKFQRLFQKNKIVIETFKPDILLINGQSLKEHGLDAQVFHLPGHTKGSIGILTKEGNFFAGDIFFNRKNPAISYYIQDESELKNSIDKIKKMNIKMVYPGHGKAFSGDELKKI